MKLLFTIDKKDYNEAWQHSVRRAVRAVMFSGERLIMVYSVRDGYYKFPGGGMKESEEHHSTLIREVREEVGLNVIPSTIKEFGEVVELRKSDMFENTIFEQDSFYYFCDTDESLSEQNLDAYEAEAGFELRYVTIEEAIVANEKHDVEFLIRETAVLRLLAERNK